MRDVWLDGRMDTAYFFGPLCDGGQAAVISFQGDQLVFKSTSVDSGMRSCCDWLSHKMIRSSSWITIINIALSHDKDLVIFKGCNQYSWVGPTSHAMAKCAPRIFLH